MSKVSVIVPVYNVNMYLRRCLDSILNQTFSDFELILVDDGSTDNSLAICEEYAATDKRIRVYTKVNEGVSVARNFGVSKASGDYIIFIDSDDFVADQYLERLYGACVNNNAQISLVNFDGIVSESQAVPRYTENYSVMTNREAIELFAQKRGPNFRSAVCKLVLSDIIKKHPFPKNRVWSEDTACVYKWYWEAEKIVEYDGAMYFYYSNPGSVSNSKFDSKYLQEIDTYEEMIVFYRENGFDKLYKEFVNYSLDVSYTYYIKAKELGCDEIAEKFRSRMKSIVKKFGSECDINISTKTDLFDIMHPWLTHMYRFFNRLIKK